MKRRDKIFLTSETTSDIEIDFVGDEGDDALDLEICQGGQLVFVGADDIDEFVQELTHAVRKNAEARKA